MTDVVMAAEKAEMGQKEFSKADRWPITLFEPIPACTQMHVWNKTIKIMSAPTRLAFTKLPSLVGALYDFC